MIHTKHNLIIIYKISLYEDYIYYHHDVTTHHLFHDMNILYLRLYYKNSVLTFYCEVKLKLKYALECVDYLSIKKKAMQWFGKTKLPGFMYNNIIESNAYQIIKQ